MRTCMGAFVLLVVSGAWGAGQVDALELRSVFDRHNEAVSAGKFKDALAVRTKDVRQDLERAMKKPRDRKEAEAMLRMTVPRSYEVLGVEAAPDGRTATLEVVGTFVPDIPGHPKRGQTLRQALYLQFAREGEWKLGVVTWGGDPDAVKRSADERPEPEGSYDLSREVSLGGRIVRVAFEPDYTLVVIRMLDEEQLAFLPSRAALNDAGFDASKLVPRRVVEVVGHPHGTNSFKTLATGAELVGE